MKFSDFYFSPGTRLLSTLAGILIGGAVALFKGWQIGVIAGAATAIVLTFIIPLLLFRQEIPYTKIKKTLKPPFLLDERVRFTVQQGSVTGYLILLQDSIVLLSMDGGNHRLELARDDVKSIILGDGTDLRIYLGQKQFIQIMSVSCEQIFQTLRENGWCDGC